MNCVCVLCNKFRYIFKGAYEKELVAGADVAIDQINKYRRGKVTSSTEAMWRLLGYAMFASKPTVKDATVHAIAALEGSDKNADASDFVKYVLRPGAVDEQFGQDGMTVVPFLEGMEATTIAPAGVKAYMEGRRTTFPKGVWSYYS